VIKRFAAIASVVLAAGALTTGSVTVANAARTALIPAGPEAHLTADATYSCGGVFFENDYGGGNGQWFYNRAASPYQLLANTARTPYCTVADGSDFLIPKNNTDECLNVESNHEVDLAKCDTSSKSQIIHIIVDQSGYEYAIDLVQFAQDTKDCIYQDGRDSPVDVRACNKGNTGDLWKLLA
jgi:hypothetical protein